MEDKTFMEVAISQASKSKSEDGYRIGAVLVRGGKIISKAFSGESKRYTHAEEYAIKKYKGQGDGVVIYTTMEPCDVRRSGKKSCCDSIIGKGIKKVVFGVLDPDTYVACNGMEKLESAGIEVIELKELREECERLTPSLFQD